MAKPKTSNASADAVVLPWGKPMLAKPAPTPPEPEAPPPPPQPKAAPVKLKAKETPKETPKPQAPTPAGLPADYATLPRKAQIEALFDLLPDKSTTADW